MRKIDIERIIRIIIGLAFITIGGIRIFNPDFDFYRLFNIVISGFLVLIGILFIYPSSFRFLEKMLAGKGGKMKYKLNLGVGTIEVERQIKDLSEETKRVKQEGAISFAQVDDQLSNEVAKIQNREYNPETSLIIIYNELDRNLRSIAEPAIESDLVSRIAIKNLVPYLDDKEILNSEVSELTLEYIELWHVIMDNSHLEVPVRQREAASDLGVDILKIIKATTFISKGKLPFKPKALVITKPTLKVSQEIITLRTYLSIKDSNDHLFSIKDTLTEKNIQVKEFCNESPNPKNAEIVSFRPLRMKRTELNIIFVIDQSGSMGNPSGMGISKLAAVKQAAISFSEKLFSAVGKETSVNMAILPFDDISDEFIRNNDSTSIWLTDKYQVKESINDIEIGPESGGTALWDALSFALQNTSEKEYRILICLSDGQDNQSKISFNKILKIVENASIPIFTIGYGTKKKSFSKLEKIAIKSGVGGENEGAFYEMMPNRLPVIFDNISEVLLNEYIITWKPTCQEPGSKVKAVFKIMYSDFHKEIEKTYSLP